ncbi:MAG: hypothetical protein HJJLKODD_00934 [Phycisphaerae bacterium]|nr:hypothetical protein [Phycisphaerae bacterium]
MSHQFLQPEEIISLRKLIINSVLVGMAASVALWLFLVPLMLLVMSWGKLFAGVTYMVLGIFILSWLTAIIIADRRFHFQIITGPRAAWVGATVGAAANLLPLIRLLWVKGPTLYKMQYFSIWAISIAVAAYLTWQIWVIRNNLGARTVITTQPECPCCGYQLIGNRSKVCPECGRAYSYSELGVTAEEFEKRTRDQGEQARGNRPMTIEQQK